MRQFSSSRSSWWKSPAWLLLTLIPAVTLAAMNVSPRNLETALRAQQELVAANPGDARVFNDLGNLLVLAGDLAQAEAAYLHALELDPEKVSTRFNLALLYQQTDRHRDALTQYQDVLKRDPRHAWAHYQIGTVYDLWRQDDLAVKHYARAFSLDSQLAFPKVNPQVIDNRLLTEALLKANRSGGSAPLVPKTYDDPSRIAQLLVPPIPVETEMEDDELEDDEMLAEDQETMDAEGEDSELLTQGDLDPNAAANQAAPLPGATRGSRYRPSTRFQRRPGNLRQFQQRQIPQQQPPQQRRAPNANSRDRSGGRPLGNVAGQPQGGAARNTNPLAGRPQPSNPNQRPENLNPSGGFQPGTSSTGRLEIRLLPEDPAKPGEVVAG